jgi:hypothetical protein
MHQGSDPRWGSPLALGSDKNWCVPDVIALFVANAGVVLEAFADPRVGAAWQEPSVLEHQTVGGLAGHLARAGIWVVAEYLDEGVPDRPLDFESAGAYYAAAVAFSTEKSQSGIRARGAEAAAAGQQALVERAKRSLDDLTPRLQQLGPDHVMSAIGGMVMRLGDYLVARMVEQVVHLDDLARSVGAEPWSLPEASVDLVIATGIEIARRSKGDTATVRALYRSDYTDRVFPVL